MLTMTPSAAEAVRALAADSGLEPDPGLRIATAEAGLHVSLVAGPESGDESVVADEAVVYLEPGVAALLDDKVLDAASDGDRIRLLLQARPRPS
jgi:hypothetical protein